jgi:KDO2-lipid IV(A) lauroyltransferase
MALRAGRLLADTARITGAGLRATVKENLRLVYGEADPDLVKRIYRHFAAAFVDIRYYDRLFDPARFDEHFLIEGPGWADFEEHGRDGAVCVTGHFGNWELFGATFQHLDIPMSAVMRPPDTPWFRRHIEQLRIKFGLEPIGKRNALPLAMRALRAGRCVAFLNDQAAGREGIPLPFLGQQAWTFLAPAALAVKLDVPLYAGYSTRIGDGIRYRCWTERVPTDGDPESITRKLNEVLEQYVRAAPEQWWWFHKRFKPPKSQRRGRKVSPAGIPE